MLPESKDEFPKCLYLDTNQWIGLSQAHYGRPEGTAFSDALAAVRQAVASRALVVPISQVQSGEAMAHSNPGRRERLARFMIDLSGSRSIMPRMIVRPWEIRNAAWDLLGADRRIPIRPSLIQAGLGPAFGLEARVTGLPPDLEELIHSIANSPEQSLAILTDLGNKRSISASGFSSDADVLRHCEDVRARAATHGITPEYRRHCELRERILHGPEGEELQAAVAEAGFSGDDFWSRITNFEDLDAFASNIPSFHVFLSLWVFRDTDQRRRIHRNDYADLDWISVAIPHSNIVVAENYWGDRIRTLHLDRQYDTVVITNLRELPKRLREVGCIS